MTEENQRASLPLEQPTEPLPRIYNGLVGSNRVPEPTTWPELVGKSVEEADRKIKEAMPTANVTVLPNDSFVTLDYQPQRVRLFVDTDGKVSRPPRTG